MSQIKLVIFDLDGVLVDSRELHFLSLNKSLEQIDTKYIISKEDDIEFVKRMNLNQFNTTNDLFIELNKNSNIKKMNDDN